MNRGLRTGILLAGGLLLLLSACALSGYLFSRAADFHVVLRSSQPRVALRGARESLEDGRILSAGPQFAQAAFMVVDSSLRWRIADTYVQQSKDLFRERQVDEAFEACQTAAQALGSYDGGDEIEGECWDLHLLLIRQGQ